MIQPQFFVLCPICNCVVMLPHTDCNGKPEVYRVEGDRRESDRDPGDPISVDHLMIAPYGDHE